MLLVHSLFVATAFLGKEIGVQEEVNFKCDRFDKVALSVNYPQLYSSIYLRIKTCAKVVLEYLDAFEIDVSESKKLTDLIKTHLPDVLSSIVMDYLGDDSEVLRFDYDSKGRSTALDLLNARLVTYDPPNLRVMSMLDPGHLIAKGEHRFKDNLILHLANRTICALQNKSVTVLQIVGKGVEASSPIEFSSKVSKVLTSPNGLHLLIVTNDNNLWHYSICTRTLFEVDEGVCEVELSTDHGFSYGLNNNREEGCFVRFEDLTAEPKPIPSRKTMTARIAILHKRHSKFSITNDQLGTTREIIFKKDLGFLKFENSILVIIKSHLAIIDKDANSFYCYKNWKDAFLDAVEVRKVKGVGILIQVNGRNPKAVIVRSSVLEKPFEVRKKVAALFFMPGEEPIRYIYGLFKK